MKVITALLLAGAGSLSGLIGSTQHAFAKPGPNLDILVIGDSQVSFGSGPALVRAFEDFAAYCKGLALPATKLEAVSELSFGMVGVRSTGLHTWLARTGREKRMLCVRDPAPNSLVNASVWGAMRHGSKWVQIGESRHHRYCRPSRTGLELLLDSAKDPPRLVILHMLARSTFRWANVERATDDLRALERMLPARTSCVYLTTAPAYRRKTNAPRLKAQANLARAIEMSGSRCRLVTALNDTTLKSFEGNARFYYRHRNGRVRDPFHPNPQAATTFFKLNRAAFCEAVVEALNPAVD